MHTVKKDILTGEPIVGEILARWSRDSQVWTVGYITEKGRRVPEWLVR
jgi:hypothetical protein